MNRKINPNPSIDHQFSVMQRIIDGTLAIDSVAEFEEILGIYENDPLLYRRYADLLHDKGRIPEATQAYHRTAELFIELNMSLQAIVAKILQWSVQKPSHEQGREFYAQLHEEGSLQTPLQKFWARMRYSELIAVMLRLVRLRLPAGTVVNKIGEPADDLYFIVSGSVAERISSEGPNGPDGRGEFEAEPIRLAENDIFGDIFPLRQPTWVHKEIRVVSDVELVKIAKNVLLGVCQKHPQIESLLMEMYKPENRLKGSVERTWQTVRRNMRFGLPTSVEIIFQSTGVSDDGWQHRAIAVDLSLGGVCLDLGPVSEEFDIASLKGRSVRIRLSLAEDNQDLFADGTIVWLNRQHNMLNQNTLLGVRFDPLSGIDRDRLLDFCTDRGGEQNLLWSLWDTMINNDEAG